LKIIKGPDFPTGGLIVKTPTIKDAILKEEGLSNLELLLTLKSLEKEDQQSL
jgi:Type IIA topoisomerase (DNA gyrase/topo II, topoisomerase IV), A subunit